MISHYQAASRVFQLQFQVLKKGARFRTQLAMSMNGVDDAATELLNVMSPNEHIFSALTIFST